MGNDGGALSNKRSVLNAVLSQTTGSVNDDGGASAAAESAHRDREAACQTCALSLRPLEPPVVGDARGHLMNRAAVLEMLLARKAGDDACTLLSAAPAAGIKKLKNVVTLAVPESAGSSVSAGQLLVCPLTEKMLSRGNVPFGYFLGCGHYFSTAAVKPADAAAPTLCPTCGAESQWIAVAVDRAAAAADLKPLATPALKLHRSELPK